MSGEPIRLTLEDGGREVPVPSGSDVLLVLPENATTGVRWSLPDESVIADENTSGEGIGSAGDRIIRLRPGPGRHHLTMVRAQPWDASTEDLRFEVTLVVE